LYCSPLISGTCSTRWKDENRCKIAIILIAGEKVGYVGVAGGIIVTAYQLKLKDSGCEFVDWRYLLQDRVRWQNVVNTAMN
jgi:hypothetical protein